MLDNWLLLWIGSGFDIDVLWSLGNLDALKDEKWLDGENRVKCTKICLPLLKYGGISVTKQIEGFWEFKMSTLTSKKPFSSNTVCH